MLSVMIWSQEYLFGGHRKTKSYLIPKWLGCQSETVSLNIWCMLFFEKMSAEKYFCSDNELIINEFVIIIINIFLPCIFQVQSSGLTMHDRKKNRINLISIGKQSC